MIGGDMEKQLLKTVGDVKVYLAPDGKFEAEVGGKTIRKPQLAQLERELAKLAGGVRVMQWDGQVARPIELVDWQAAESSWGSPAVRFRGRDGELDRGYIPYYRYDESVMSDLQALHEEEAAAERDFAARREAIKERAVRLSGDELKGLIKESRG
jgi:hypothetical protein